MTSGIEIRDLSCAYVSEKPIFQGLSLKFEQDEITMMLGPNGCGKTTLLKCMANLLHYQNGEILVCGRLLQSYRADELARTIAYVAQSDTEGSGHLVRDYLVLGRAPHVGLFQTPTTRDYEIVEEYAAEFGLETLMEVPVSNLSGGQMQMVSIVRALVQETPIILMDEPAASLDLKNQALLLELIQELRRHHRTIILSTHDPNHAYALHCRTVLLADGKIVGVGAADCVLSQENLCRTFGARLTVLQSNGITGYAFRPY